MRVGKRKVSPLIFAMPRVPLMEHYSEYPGMHFFELSMTKIFYHFKA